VYEFCSPDSQSGSPFQSPPALVIADKMPPLYAFEVAEVRLADPLAGLSRVADLGFGLPMGDLCKAGHRGTSW
jgi:hypothetical protein